MNILLVGLRSPLPAYSGGQMRRWEILRYLARRHRVTFIYFDASDAPTIPQALHDLAVRAIPVTLPRALSPQDAQVSKHAPWILRSYGAAAMCRAIEFSAPHTFDLVLVDSLYMSLYRALLPPQTVLLEQNIESQIHKQAARLNETASEQMRLDFAWRAMEQYENRVWAQFGLRVVVSASDKREMKSRCATGQTIVVENGVNPEEYPLLARPRDGAVFFAGAFDYFPNMDAAQFFVREILPHVARAAPATQVLIAGSNPPEPVRALSDSQRVRVIPNPPEMQTFAAQAAVAVVPLRVGSGTRLKILEALAWGIPVVTTTRGCEGLDVQDGRHLLIRDEPREFAEALVQVLNDEPLAQHLRVNGRALVEHRYAWQNILPQFENALFQFTRQLPLPMREGVGG